MATLYTRLTEAVNLATEVERLLTVPHSAAIESARVLLSTAESAEALAGKRVRDAAEALRLVKLAKTSSGNPAVGKAISEAEHEKAEADAALAARKEQTRAAKDALRVALTPVKPATDLTDCLNEVRDARDGNKSGHARLAVLSAEMLLADAKTGVQGVTEAEAKVATCKKSKQTASGMVNEAEKADRHMQEAAGKSELKSIKDAASATASELATAKLELEAASGALVRAETELSKMVKPIQVFLDLVTAVVRVRDEATKVDEAHRQRVAWEEAQQREAEERQAARDADPCQCSENYRCGYCYQRQNDMATGQAYIDHDDPCR